MPLVVPLTLPVLYTLAAFGGCDIPDPPKIRVEVAHAPIRYDFTRTKPQLAGFKIDTISPYAASEHAEIGGLMGGQVTVRSEINIAWSQQMLTRQSCYWYSDIKIVLQTEPTIYIAREFPKGTCRHKAVLAHEMEHVRIDRAIVGDYIPHVEEAARRAARAHPVLGPVKGDPAAYQKQLSGYIEKSVDAVTQKMYEERRKKQQALDTRAEYERISSSCP